MREAKLSRYCMDRLERLPDSFWFVTTGGVFQRRGIPDIVGCLRGTFVGLELKTSRGRPTTLQVYTLEKLLSSGGVGAILFGKEGVEEALEWLRSEDLRCEKVRRFPDGQ